MTTFNYTTYPAVRAYFKNTFFKVAATKPKVFEIFKKYSLFTRAEAKRVLKMGWTPRVQIRRLHGRYGYTPTTGDAIELDRHFLQDLDAILRDPAALSVYDYYRLKARAELLLEITTLHELVHWCRQQVNGVNWNRRVEEATAQRFEREAYGLVHNAKTLRLQEWVR